LRTREGLEVLAGLVTERTDRGRHRVGAQRETADRGDIGKSAQLFEHQAGHEPEPLRVERDGLAVDVEGRALSRREGDVETVAEGSLAHQFDETGTRGYGIEDRRQGASRGAVIIRDRMARPRPSDTEKHGARPPGGLPR
jgi:hypothetical protein